MAISPNDDSGRDDRPDDGPPESDGGRDVAAQTSEASGETDATASDDGTGGDARSDLEGETDPAVDGTTGGDTGTRSGADGGWPRQYVRDHLVHALVVATFAIYPVFYVWLVDSPATIPLVNVPIADVTSTFLPGLTFMIVVLYLGLFAMSFDFISGYTGYLSFGHAAFFGVGAYFVVMATNGLIPGVPADTPFMITMLLGATAAFLLALAMGAVSFRLTGVYFAMITLGFGQVLYELIRNWDYVASNPSEGPSVDGGGLEIGVPYVDSLSVAVGRLTGDSFENVLGTGFEIGATMTTYYALAIVVVLCYFAMQRILHSPFGRVMIAIRENEERAEAVGYNVFWYKMAAFAFSAFFAAVAGALFAAYSRSISPEDSFFFLVTADALITTIVGGIGTLAGPLFGVLFHEWLGDILSSQSGGLAPFLREHLPGGVQSAEAGGVTIADVINTALAGRAPLYLGIVFVLFVLFVPNGLLGSIRGRLGGTVAKRFPDRLERYRR